MKKVFIAGHRGMVGSEIFRQLHRAGELELVTTTRSDLDLLNQESVFAFFKENAIDEVYLAAAKVGGIVANNTYRADFIYENLQIQNNIIHASHLSGVDKLLLLGSSCIYPKHAEQPIKESELLSGPLEITNEPYAIAKIAGLKMCEAYADQYGRDFRAVMPTNLYGPGDNFHPENSHVIPGLMHRFRKALSSQAPKIHIWGSGTPRREFLHVADMASACIHVMRMSRQTYGSILGETKSHINIGTGEDCSIRDLAEELKNITGFEGELEFDTSKPDGTPRKLLDVTKLNQAGWLHDIPLNKGLESTWKWYLEHHPNDTI